MVVYLRSLLDVDIDHGPQLFGVRFELLTRRTVTFCIVWLPFQSSP